MRFAKLLLATAALGFICSTTLPAAMIQLNNDGADPPITSPSFSFTTDANGFFSADFDNRTSPPQNFGSVQITAHFTLSSVITILAGCNPDAVFTQCSITVDPTLNNLVFNFFGLDAGHPGFQAGFLLGITATNFEPNQILGALASPTNAPEPGSLALFGGGLGLFGLLLRRHKLRKPRIFE